MKKQVRFLPSGTLAHTSLFKACGISHATDVAMLVAPSVAKRKQALAGLDHQLQENPKLEQATVVAALPQLMNASTEPPFRIGGIWTMPHSVPPGLRLCLGQGSLVRPCGRLSSSKKVEFAHARLPALQAKLAGANHGRPCGA